MSAIDLIFDPEAEDFNFQFELPFGTLWTDLFDTFCIVFIQGCMKISKKTTFDDLLFIKGRLKMCNVLCKIETYLFEDPVHYPFTMFTKGIQETLDTSYLQVLGDAVYRVRFVPRFQQNESTSSGCMA